MGSLVEGNLLRGRYEIIKIQYEDIGNTIYMAKDRMSLNSLTYIREIDLKVKTGKSLTLAGINNMVSILSLISYKGIPKFIDFFSGVDTYYIIEEFIEGRFLEEVLAARSEPFNFSDVYKWMLTLCDTLHYLHGLEKPVIVRGINPSTLKITVRNEIKLIDFSMARFYDEKKDIDTLFVWNPGYTSPEQYGNQKSDIRSDIYGFGATFYRILTKQDIGLLNFNFPSAGKYNTSLTKEQSAFLARCLEKDPQNRFQSALAMKNALRDLDPFKEDLSQPKVIPLSTPPKKKGLAGFIGSIFGKKDGGFSSYKK